MEGLLQEYLDRSQLASGNNGKSLDDNKCKDQVEHVDENQDSFLDGSVMEKILQRRSLQLRNKQRAWKV